MGEQVHANRVLDYPAFMLRCGIPAFEQMIASNLEAAGFQRVSVASIVILVDAPYGFALQQLERRNCVNLHTIVTTCNPCPEYCEDVWALQPTILLAINCLHNELETAIRRARTGERYRLTDGTTTQLTPTERRVLYYVARDWSNKQIATQLHIKPQSVANTLNSIYSKLSVRGKVGAAFYYWGRADLLR